MASASFLLDTNVVSELARPAPAPPVVSWVAAQAPLALHLSALTFGEIEAGVARMAGGARRDALARWARTELPRQFAGRVLAVDVAVALAWGRVVAAGRDAGRTAPMVDALLVATAVTHGLTLVTRNVADCAGRGAPVFDPWTGTLHRA